MQNTSQMSPAPDSPDEFVQLDSLSDAQVEVRPIYSGRAFNQLVAYQVIVEMWKQKNYGRVKRAWLKEFTQAERTTISNYHGRFYRWTLVSGTPDHVSCRMKTLHLLQRAVAFFASV